VAKRQPLADMGVIDPYLVVLDPVRLIYRAINFQLPAVDHTEGHASSTGPVAIVPVGNESFGIHRAVDHLRHLVGPLRQRDQVRLLLGVQVDRPTARLPVDAHVGHLPQPPGSHLVEVIQATELPAAQQILLDEQKWPLHLALRLWPPWAARHRPEAIVRGEGQEAGIVDRLAVLIAGHDDLHVVVQAGRCRTVQVLEGPHVLADGRLQVLRSRKVDVLTAEIPAA
jgi:hypothetical protein